MIHIIISYLLALSLAGGMFTNMFTRNKGIEDSLYRKLMWIPIYGFYISGDYSKEVLKNKWWYWWSYHFAVIVLWVISYFYKF